MRKIIYTFIFLSIIISSICYSQNLSGINIGIVHSESTKKLIYHDNERFYPVQDWELFFLNRKISYTIISDNDLENNNLDELDVLILPSVEVLSQRSSDNLSRFLNNGKGLFVLGELGKYNEEGRKSNSKFLLKHAGFSYKDLDIKDNISTTHSLKTSSVLCKGMSYNNDLLIQFDYSPLVTESLSENVESVGQYILPENRLNNESNSGIVLSKKGNGKVVWLGFRLSQIGNKKSEGSIVEKLIFNCIEWLSQKPVVMVKSWPENYKFPVLFVNNIIDTKIFSSENLEKFRLANNQTNFFIESDALVNADNELLSKLNLLGDINLLLNLDLTSKSELGEKLDRIYNNLHENCDQNYYGIKLSNIYSDNLPDDVLSSQFTFFELVNNKILLKSIGESDEKSSFNLPIEIIFHSITGKDKQSVLESISLLKNDVINNEKLLILSFINQIKTGSNLKALDYVSDVIQYLKEENAWITTYSRLINWILNKDNLVVNTGELKESNKFEIKVENRSQNEMKDIVLLLFPPAGKSNPRLFQPEIKLDYNRNLGVYNITVPYIRAGTQKIINVQFSDAKFSTE